MIANISYSSLDGRRGITIFTIAFALIFFFLSVSSYREILIERQATAWPKVQGNVFVSKTLQRTYKHHDYTPIVRYKYIVAGRIYTGGAISFGPAFGGTESEAADVASHYPIGSVLVTYNPKYPEQAVLFIGTIRQSLFTNLYGSLASCIVSVLLTIWLLRAAIKAERRLKVWS